MRLFVAVDVPQDVKDAIERDVVGALRDALPDARWTRPEGRHLTLTFLGEVADERATGVGQALAEAASRHVGFDAAFAELGGFPNVRRPRVLWLGVDMGAEELSALAADVEDVLRPLGFPGEDRPFRAHVTLARFPKPRLVGSMPAVAVPSTTFRVDEVVLFRSQLHPKGARYAVLERIPLAR